MLNLLSKLIKIVSFLLFLLVLSFFELYLAIEKPIFLFPLLILAWALNIFEPIFFSQMKKENKNLVYQIKKSEQHHDIVLSAMAGSPQIFPLNRLLKFPELNKYRWKIRFLQLLGVVFWLTIFFIMLAAPNYVNGKLY